MLARTRAAGWAKLPIEGEAEMQNRIADKLFTKTRPGQASVVDDSRSLRDASSQQLQRSLKRLETLIVSHPAVCLGAAIAVGITLGWWVKRK